VFTKQTKREEQVIHLKYAIYTLRANGKRLFHGITDLDGMHYFIRNNPTVDKLVIDMIDGSEYTYNGR
jgi:hypothetical protein